MRSAIYEGRVVHRRLEPVEHRFNFNLFYFYLDLNELDDLFESRLLFSSKRIAPIRFQYREHMAQANVSDRITLRAAVLDTLVEHGVSAKIGSICIMTQLRYFGFAMNPVNFYFCYDESNIHVAAIILEVNNTPWNEQHLYVVSANCDNENKPSSKQSIEAKGISKEFHVSPFMPLKMSYNFRFDFSNDKLGVFIQNIQDGNKPFEVAMQLKRKPITTSSLNLSLIKYPFLSWKIFAGIYWQATKLWWKKAPFFPHPDKSMQLDHPPSVSPEKSAYPVDHQTDAVRDERENLVNQ